MHYKAHNNYMKSLEIYKNNITVFCLKKTPFWQNNNSDYVVEFTI